MAKLTVGFLGAGKMATALAKGILSAGLVKASQIRASDPLAAALSAFARETGVNSKSTNLEVVQFASTLILAVKPAHVAEVLEEIRPSLAPRHLIISIAAGVPLGKLETGAGAGIRIIRVMPNAPALVNASASAYALGHFATDADSATAQKLFAAVGLAYPLKESLLDAVTGLSGSGPAYIFMIIEALSDGGVAAGLPRDIATQLAAQTVFGAAKMVLETGRHPGALKDMVTSPGGTTIEGLHELEKGKLRGVLISAVRAASEKSRKLGQSLS